MVTAEAFLSLTSQVQALAGMVQTIIPYLPQLVHSMAHQSAPPKEVLKSREEIGESSKDGSPFTPEIQSKPLPATFRLPALEPYNGSGDPMEHIATFRAQVALYDTLEALIVRVELFGKCTPEADHGLTHRDGSRERRAPPLVRRKIHIASPGNPRPPSIPSHPSVPDGVEAVKVLLVTDLATTDDSARDVTGAPVYGGRDADSWQAG
ncbi:hypothetical protein B296_00043664 [Ensete ventricosum]|uniref:Uncharacterized protein n=1 Tax=Ensete ventricosum TaxID=4639 RepID=A0A426YU89_ENSVE|nr:hypothetical protein B296_00043664 [Ensete ventricosum]